MAVPAYIDDGSYLTPRQVNSDQFSFPFLARGDAVSFELKRRYRVAATSYRRLALMQRINVPNGFGTAYLVEQSDPNEVANGILEYEVTYASVPKKRNEPTSVNYPIQFLKTQRSFSQGFQPEAGDVADAEVWELPITLAAMAVYEYFIKPPRALIAARIAVLGGTLVNYGNWGTAVAGQTILAFDSETSLYKGGIIERRSIYITNPTVVFR